MKATHVVVGVAAVVAAVVAYRYFSKPAGQRRVDDYAAGYGSGNEPVPPAVVWNGTSWVPAPPVVPGIAADAPRFVSSTPAPPPPMTAPSGLTPGVWAEYRAKAVPVPPVGSTASLLPSELAILSTLRPLA